MNLTSGDWLVSSGNMAYQELSISLHHWQIGHLLVIIANFISGCVFYLPTALSTSYHHRTFVNELIEQAQRLLRKETA